MMAGVTEMWNKTGVKDLYDAGRNVVTGVMKDIQKGTIDPKGNEVTQATQKSISGCPAELKKILANGSVVANIAEQQGLPSAAESYIRGLIGDVIISGDGPVITALTKPGCSQNIEDMAAGRIQTMGFSGGAVEACQPAGSKTDWKSEYTRNYRKYVEAVKSKTPLDEDTMKAINNDGGTGAMIVLKAAVSQGLPEYSYLAQLSDIAAKGTAYQMLYNLLEDTRMALYRAESMIMAQGSSPGLLGSDPEMCNVMMLEQPRIAFTSFFNRAGEIETRLKKDWDTALRELAVIQSVAKSHQEFNETAQRRLAKSMGVATAARIFAVR